MNRTNQNAPIKKYTVNVWFSFCLIAFISRTKFSKVLMNRKYLKFRHLQCGFIRSVKNVICINIVNTVDYNMVVVFGMHGRL